MTKDLLTMTTRTIGLFNTLLMLTLIIFWGSSFVVVKIALGEGLTPVAIATFRFLIAGGLFLATLLFKKNRERDYRILVERKDARPCCFLLSLVSLFSSLFSTRAFKWQDHPSPRFSSVSFRRFLSPFFPLEYLRNL